MATPLNPLRGFPSLESPLTNKGGFLTQAWYRFLLAIYLRTVELTGEITLYGGATAPSSTLQCNGAAISRTTYAALFAVIGTTFGPGDGSTTFNIPNQAAPFAGAIYIIYI